jgi:two-component system, cell cycle response regulator DivK
MADENRQPIRVLFVEDDRATRDGYHAYLTAHGLEVQSAANAHEALLFAATVAPDVIVLDLGLPDIDGWEVARQLKAGPRTMSVPIIALTGAAMPHERASAMRAGCDRYLTKPCVPADLLEAIRRSVGEPT